MNRLYTSIFIILFLFPLVYAQPRLGIEPHNIEFEDIFNRLEVVYFINEGDQPLRIDSITYGNDIYFIRFDGYARYPFTIQPNDSVRMDCILAGYLYVGSVDTVDTMIVHNNGVKPQEDARLKIDFFDDDFRFGTMNGFVSDGSIPVENAIVRFMYEGTYIIDTAHTAANGFFTKKLPPGSYLAAAEKDGYYTSFYDSVYDPFTAKTIRVAKDSTSSGDIKITPMPVTGISAAGMILDSTAGTYLKRGTVVIRKGTHNPSRPFNGNIQVQPVDVYTTFIKNDGTYLIDNIIDPDYYYMQSFADYFVPTYYTANNSNPAFWQQADSIFLNSNLTQVDIEMPRDSSVGGGSAAGTIIFGDANAFSDVLVYAESMTNNLLYSYGLSEETGTFDLSFLPYGTYRLVGQKLGYENAYSDQFIIDPLNTGVTGLVLNFTTVGVDDVTQLPDKLYLYQNYPNPFNPSTTIEFYVPEERELSIILYNVLGQQIRILENGTFREGRYAVNIDGSQLSSGIYFVSLRSGSDLQMRKLILLK